VGIAEYKINNNLVVEIEYKDKRGDKMFPNPFFISKQQALRYPTQTVKNTVLRIIPIADMMELAPEMVISPK
jgi:hypothetical protein